MAITPSKVIQGHRFDTNRKPICDFLSLIDANLHLISHSYCRLLDTFWLSTGGGHLSLTYTFWVNSWIRDCEICSQTTTNIARIVQSAFRHTAPLRRSSRAWQTDRRTDRQTKRR